MDDNDNTTASPARKIHRSRTVSCTELTEEQLRNIVAKILQVSWSEDSAGTTFVSIAINLCMIDLHVVVIKRCHTGYYLKIISKLQMFV